MNIRKDILENSGLLEAMQIVKSHNREVAKQNKQKKLNREFEISKGKNFMLSILYLNVQESGLKSESINLEGFKNASEIYEIYRKIGHDLKIFKIQLYLEGKKVQGAKFNY